MWAISFAGLGLIVGYIIGYNQATAIILSALGH
jgi:hypothetical protein